MSTGDDGSSNWNVGCIPLPASDQKTFSAIEFASMPNVRRSVNLIEKLEGEKIVSSNVRSSHNSLISHDSSNPIPFKY